MYPSTAYKRVNLFADAFSHFNSKLLATGANPAGMGCLEDLGVIAYPGIDGEGESLFDRRQRPAAVSTDVKALFDGPGGPYPPVDDSASLGFAGPLSFHDPRRVPEFWQPAGALGVSIVHSPV